MTDPGPVRRRATGTIAIVAVASMVFGLVGCTGDGDDASRPADSSRSLGSSPDIPDIMIDAPGDYALVEEDGYTISAPDHFERQSATSANGEPMLVLEKPSRVEGVPQRVAVIRDVDPVASASEQSLALKIAKSAADPEAGAGRVEVPTGNDTGMAYLIRWDEMLPRGDVQALVDVTYWQLMYQEDGGPILNVVAFAPTEEFEASAVSTILRTFAPTSSP